MAPKKGYITIDPFYCKECHYCISVCKNSQIIHGKTYNEKGYRSVVFIGDGGCTACGLCAVMCPEVAIEVYRD
ncbi:MAG: 4Fe-4S dicluster domain-containing protein [Deltaproteobacteria bacterium]|nr:4Fe-4S dicluster domain-containing protein [Deltaproteobacteria bacterium]